MIAGLQRGLHPVPQPGRGPSRGAEGRSPPDELFDQRPAAHDLALPVDDRARVPAAVHRPADGGRHPRGTAAAFYRPPGRVHPRRVPGGRVPLRPSHGPAPPTAPTSPATPTARRSSAWSSIRRRTGRPTPTTCAAAPGRRAASSAGRRSSTSAAPRPRTCGRTSGSTRRSRRRCSTCPCGAIAGGGDRPRRCRSAICSARSPGAAVGPERRAAHAASPAARARAIWRSCARTASISRLARRSGYYVLKEAEVVGRRSAPGAGRGPRSSARCSSGCCSSTGTLISAAAAGGRACRPGAATVTGDFRMVDFLTFAGVDPTSRGQ